MAFTATLDKVAHGDFTISIDVIYKDSATPAYAQRHHFDFPSTITLAAMQAQVIATGTQYKDAITKTATLVTHVGDVITVP